MAVTKSWETKVAPQLVIPKSPGNRGRNREFLFLALASLLVAGGLAFVFSAKTDDFAQIQTRIMNGELIDINSPALTQQDLEKTFRVIGDDEHRTFAAAQVIEYLQGHRPLLNIGALSRMRIRPTDGALWQRLTATTKTPPASLPLLPLGKVKPLMLVRSPEEFRHIFLIWTLGYLAAFWMVHLAWRVLKFRGDGAILPALHLLTGMGLILMVSLRDPLRDTLEFKKFAWGCMAGCALLLLPLFKAFDYRRLSRLVYTPLFLALALFVALLKLGSGPTGSDAKVNLGPFQPVEVIKLLLVFFLAAYFAKTWEHLRDLHQKGFLRRLEIPRLNHALPVIVGVSSALAMFFVLKDMGPALVMGFVFLLLFAVARGRSGLALLGVTTLIVGVIIGNHYGTPHTVVERVAMWLSPWNNDVRGGDQLAHSLWAFATGGPLGSGPGWGDPSVIPAGHTDLVLSSLAEEWGLPGVLSVCLLFALLLRRAFSIAVHAVDEYSLFLAAGLATLIALEMLLISGGALGAIPLSGVVSPFLSSGNTAMLANFFIFAVLLSISNQSAAAQMPEEQSLKPVFQMPIRVVGMALAGCALALLCRATYIQVLEEKSLIARDALVFTADGVKRPEHNPRLNLLAAEIPRGNILDRNGVLLATSSWDELEKHRAELEKLGVQIDQACNRADARHYPFGPATEHLLGDLRTGEKFHASNASLIEHDSNTRLQGYRDYSELAPVVRYRHQRANPLLQALLKRDRDVHSTIDIRLQVKAAEILRANLEAPNKKGALVAMNAQTGEVLALVSYPAPPANGSGNPDELLDRARYGQYPPGSTFKLVTAVAALRLDPHAMDKKYTCRGLGDGRVGTEIPGWRRPIRDDIGDHAHGTLDMASAITVSCNAYFAQLGVDSVGSKALQETAGLFGIPVGTPAQLKKMLPFSSYGQGEVLMTPFKMARVAATIANGGQMPEGEWVTDASNARTNAPHPIVDKASADFLAKAMRSVVSDGTARAAMSGLQVSVAGKTGTAQLDDGDPHSWFAGFAPYDADAAKRISFAVVVEHGGYGAKFAAPIARQFVQAAQDAKIFEVTQ